ncbi:hypothetical protein N182_37545 [Sinorhizobium sp. GL2]|nr:hypothetical protein N182_37545 [Sinorhizobium sp. GL2]
MGIRKNKNLNANYIERTGYLPGLIYLCATFFLPVLYLFMVSLWKFDSTNYYNFEWTIENYKDLLTDEFYLTAIARTIYIGCLVTAICLAIGFPLAMFLCSASAAMRSVMMAFLVAPLFTSAVIRVFGWQILLQEDGMAVKLLSFVGVNGGSLMGTNMAVIIGIVHVELPFMVFPIVAALSGIPRHVIEAARTLGAHPLTVVRTIALPLATPGIVSGCTLVFSVAISAFVQPLLLGGSSYFIIPTLAFHEVVTRLNFPLGAALGFIMLLVALCASLLLSQLGRRRQGI